MTATPKSRRRKWLGRLAWTLGVLCLLGVIASVFVPYFSAWRIHKFEERLRDNPSVDSIDTANLLLINHEVSERDGGKILEILTKPVVTIRHAYRNDRPVTVALAYPINLFYGFMDIRRLASLCHRVPAGWKRSAVR